MNGFRAKTKFFNIIPGISTVFWLCLGFSGSGCGGERDVFSVGFNCEDPIHTNHSICGLPSGAVTFVSP